MLEHPPLAQRLTLGLYRLSAHRRGEPGDDLPVARGHPPWPKRVAKEVELDVLVGLRSSAILAVHDPRLLRMHLQAAVLDALSELLAHLLGADFRLAMEDAIISVAAERNVRVVAFEPVIQGVVQEQISEDGRERTALRDAFRPRNRHPVRPMDRGLEPALHMEQHPAFIAVMMQCFQKQGMIDFVEG